MEDIENKLVPLIEYEKRGGIMTIAETFKRKGKIEGKLEGKIEGKIEAYQKLLKDSLIPKKIADTLKQEILELTKKLEALAFPKPRAVAA